MSSDQETVTGLTNNHFEFESEITDPKTGQTRLFPMEIDTGSPFALILPKNCEVFFSEYVTDFDLSGAGSKNSPAYSAIIETVGDIDVDYDTLAIMSLSSKRRYGLIGIELLKKLEAEISDKPENKKLRLKNTYID